LGREEHLERYFPSAREEGGCMERAGVSRVPAWCLPHACMESPLSYPQLTLADAH
jgi:hypothetical protein